jgi:hypothetical protein
MPGCYFSGANFVELRQRELRRIPIPGNSVNRLRIYLAFIAGSSWIATLPNHGFREAEERRDDAHQAS